MEKESSKENQFENDWKLYQEFLKAWADGSLDESNPVCQMVTESSLTIHKRYKYKEEVDSMRQICFLVLTNGQYKGKTSLKTYIWGIYIWAIKHYELRRRQKKGKESLEIKDWIIERVTEEVIQRMSSEQHMKTLLASVPKFDKKLIETIAKNPVTTAKQITHNTHSKQFVSPEQADLLHKINNIFPTEKRQRYNELYARFKSEDLGENEYEELLELSNEFEILNANRLKYIGKLAKLRGQSLEQVIDSFEIPNSDNEKEIHFG
ncbi:MAG TPA: hypothetical protein VGB68_05030 [Pyrinomonadaceae bacterium]|jgi:hypothetical protein